MAIAERPVPNWPRLDELDVPTGPPFLIDELIHATSTIIFGRSGSGKSWVAESMAFAIRNSPTWFGRTVFEPSDVAYWALDPGQQPELKSRAVGLQGVLPIIPDLRPSISLELFDDFGADLERLGVGVLIVDNLLRLMTPGRTIRNDEDVRVALEKLDRLIAHGISIVLVHHSGKTGEYGTPKTPLGSTAIQAWGRHFLRVEQDKSGLVTIESSGNNAQPFTIKTRIDPDVRGDTPFFTEVVEAKARDRSEDRIVEATVVAVHMAKVGPFPSISAAADYLVKSPPPGVKPRDASAWRAYITRKVIGPKLYVKGSGYSIHPNLEPR